MPFINCKVELSLTWDPSCVLPNLVGASTFTITDAKLYVPIVTLSTEDNAKLSKLLSKGFKRPINWNKYKVIRNKTNDENNYIRQRVDTSYLGVKRLFVLAYRDRGGANRVTADSHRRYFLKNWNYNIEIDGRNFYDQPINDFIKQCDEVRKVSSGQGDDYTTDSLLAFAYFKKKLPTNCSWFKQKKALDANSRAFQQIILTGKANSDVMIYYILEQPKETTLQFCEGTRKVL